MSRIIPKDAQCNRYDDITRVVYAEHDGWSLTSYSDASGRDLWQRISLERGGYQIAEKMTTMGQLQARMKGEKSAPMRILEGWIKDVMKSRKKMIKEQRYIASEILSDCDKLEDILK